MVLQYWCTLRLSDHRGVDPASIRVKGASFCALLTCSKTPGPDKTVGSRPLVVASSLIRHGHRQAGRFSSDMVE